MRKILMESARRENQNKDVVYLMRAFIDAGLYLPTSKKALATERARLNYFLLRLRRYENEGRLVCRKDSKGRRYFKQGEIDEIVRAFNLGGTYHWDYRGEKATRILQNGRMEKWYAKSHEMAKKAKSDVVDEEYRLINLKVLG